MSFLDNVKARTTGATGASNPFATNAGSNNPFAPKTTTTASSTTATTPKPSAPVGAPSAPAFTAPKVGTPAPAPGLVKPVMPKAPSFVPTQATAPAPAPTPVAEEPKEVTTEELINDVKTVKVEEPVEVKEEAKVEEVKAAEEVKTETKEEAPVEKKEEAKAETKKKAKPRASAKKKATPSVEPIVDEPINEEEAEKVETMFKIPTTNMKYADAIKAVTRSFVDQEWENFRAGMIAKVDDVVIESDMQEGAIKKAISQLNRLRDEVWLHYCDTQAMLENLSSKDMEGIIETIKFSNLEGSNETSRKKAAVLAVMNYKTPEGKTINLYEVYYETRARFLFLKGLMDTVEYKSRILITMSGALKMQKGNK